MDRPQVQAAFTYTVQQSDEFSLEKGDQCREGIQKDARL